MVEITKETWPEIFEKYYFDARKHAPKKGQVLARYVAMAELGADQDNSQLKSDLIMLLKMDKAESAAKVLNRLGGAVEPDNYRVCREICEDLLSGMTEEEVRNKAYKFKYEQMFYTERQYVPEHDPHWETVKLLFDPNEYMKHFMKLSEETNGEENSEKNC